MYRTKIFIIRNQVSYKVLTNVYEGNNLTLHIKTQIVSKQFFCFLKLQKGLYSHTHVGKSKQQNF